MYYVELVYLDDQGEEITHETITLYAENETARRSEGLYSIPQFNSRRLPIETRLNLK